MAIKFTEREMIGIRRKLKDYARRTVVHTSMQKITIGALFRDHGGYALGSRGKYE